MPTICPECQGEFRDGIVQCPDCGVETVLPSRPIDERFVDPGIDRPAPNPLLETPENVVVFESGKLWEADLMAGVFDEEGIPYFRQDKTSSGVTFNLPVAPSMAPGDTWTIVVPKPFSEEASELVLAHRLALPSDESANVWGFAPTARGKVAWKLYALVALSLFALIAFFGIAENFRELLP